MVEVIEHVAIATYHCDHCPNGRLYPEGEIRAEAPRILHRCHVCGEYEYFDKCYNSMWVEFAEGPSGKSES